MNKETFGERALAFYSSLVAPAGLPRGVTAMNPYTEEAVQENLKKFLSAFFSDREKRTLILGINPGRFGSGITGVTFTDPVALETFCKIPNGLPKRREVSSEFVYQAINAFGGPQVFYRSFFMSAVAPLGFLKNNLNYNYYDDPELRKATKDFIIKTLRQQIELGTNTKHVILLGTGKNLKAFQEINDEYTFFENILALPHPRFVMQYKRKELNKHIAEYVEAFQKALI